MQGRRERQQDRVACLTWPNDCHLLILADGMGGHASGDVASSTVVDSFRRTYLERASLSQRDRLLGALQEANYALFDRIQSDPDCVGMGTTVVAVAINRGELLWVSVGDSPLWLFREGALRRLNKNHSVGSVLDERAAPPGASLGAALLAASRSELAEAVLGREIELVDAPHVPLELACGDILLLGSDGVETCSDEDLAALASADASASSESLVDCILREVAARDRPRQDNATVIAFRVTGPEPAVAPGR